MERVKTTRSGLVLPDTAKERLEEDEIIAVGPGRLTDDGKRALMGLKPGQFVFYAKYAGSGIKEIEDELLLLTERDILAQILT